MKEIKAFIRPRKALEVTKALRAAGFCCMTLTECEGTGKYTDPQESFPSFTFPFMHSKMVKVEIVCPKKDVAQIVNIIQQHGRTGHTGDGIIYVLDVEQVFRVKNQESGMQALA